ncbi:MAG: hypothetical protein RJA99_3139 [Pseudomonadota bacterium]|jgi:hypothetical protein
MPKAKPPVIWEPTQKQAEFLSCDAEEVLYGGSAGGGKSDALLIDALGLAQGAIQISGYTALLVRKTYGDLGQLIKRSMDLYPRIVPGAKFTQTKNVWDFPSGAQVLFAYADAESDKDRFQGKEFQYIAIDELTQHPTPGLYENLISRLRAPERMKIKKYVRATCNPGGPGHAWVRQRFDIPDDGRSSGVDVDLGGGKTWRRRFIPARITDNPHLSGTGYAEQLSMLSEMERRALLEGRWDVVEVRGQIYKAELEALVRGDRLTSVPYEPNLPVHTAWDLGINDPTAIWFFQIHGREVRVIDYYESNNEAIPHFVKVLRDKGYIYGDHWGPHDIVVRSLNDGLSRFDTAKALGVTFKMVPRGNIADGIHAVRMVLPRVWMDKERCKRGWEALTNYRSKWNEAMGTFSAEPIHDWASNGSDAFRYLATVVNKSSPKSSAPKSIYSGFDYSYSAGGEAGWMAS